MHFRASDLTAQSEDDCGVDSDVTMLLTHS